MELRQLKHFIEVIARISAEWTTSAQLLEFIEELKQAAKPAPPAAD
jgi:hypothetical protein